MSAYQEGDRVRAIQAEATGGIYKNGSTGTVTGESESGLTVRWDHNGKVGMVFEREVERLYNDEPSETPESEADGLTVWDRYAIAALQGVMACPQLYRQGYAETAAREADKMMELRRGKVS